MNAAATSSSFHFLSTYHGQCGKKIQYLPLPGRYVSPKNLGSRQIQYSLFRRSSKKIPPKSEPRLEFVIDLDGAANRASASLKRFSNSSRAKWDRFLSSGSEALADLQSLVAVDRHGRVVIACRRSSLQFMGNFLICCFFAILGFRVLLELRSGLEFGGWYLVRRRDRSLGGREVVVGRKLKKKDHSFSVNPLSSVGRLGREYKVNVTSKCVYKERLPKWWPNSMRSPVVAATGNEQLQMEANRLVRAIMDNRMSGKDLAEDEIIQLRRLCRTSGAKVSFETANTRDSFYRAAVDFVLASCGKSRFQPNQIQIDGEGAPEFIAGLADNVRLEDIRAATFVSAAVAARTRSGFLQAWAFEIQGKRSEALDQLLKICHIHHIFPPEEYSPEMEMVARGLEKHLKVEQREHLYALVRGVCSTKSQRSVEEALGLTPFALKLEGSQDGLAVDYIPIQSNLSNRINS